MDSQCSGNVSLVVCYVFAQKAEYRMYRRICQMPNAQMCCFVGYIEKLTKTAIAKMFHLIQQASAQLSR